jgi:site-specific recombinase
MNISLAEIGSVVGVGNLWLSFILGNLQMEAMKILNIIVSLAINLGG